MDAPFRYRTRSEQRVDYLKGLRRPLDEAEQDELYRALHAIYVRELRIDRELRATALAESRQRERGTLEKIQRELIGAREEAGL